MKSYSSTARSERLSVVHALAPGFAGGLESVVAALAIGHHRRGHQVRVISALEIGLPDPTLHGRLENAGVEVVRVALPPRTYLRERAAYRDSFHGSRPDLVHTHGYRADVLAGSAARRLGLPLATTVHGFTGGDWKNRLYERLQLRAFRRFDAIVAVSDPLSTRLIGTGLDPDRVVVIPNAFESAAPPLSGLEARSRLGLLPDSRVIGWVGRLSREKGLDVLIDAMSLVNDRSVTLSVLGDGGERDALHLQSKRLGLSERIRWHGMVPEAGALYPAFDAFVLSSRTEGTPISLFEAMAAGVPVVASAVGGVPFVVSDREALLVPPDSPAALARAIDALVADPASAACRAERAADCLSRRYALEPWLDRYEALYHALKVNRQLSSA